MTLSTPASGTRSPAVRDARTSSQYLTHVTSENSRPPLSFRVRYIIIFFKSDSRFFSVVRSLVLDVVPLHFDITSSCHDRNPNRRLWCRFVFNLFAPGSIIDLIKLYFFISTDTFAVCVFSVVSSRYYNRYDSRVTINLMIVLLLH